MELILEQSKRIYHKLECSALGLSGQDTAEIMDIPETYNTRDGAVMRDGQDYNPCPICCQHDMDNARRNG